MTPFELVLNDNKTQRAALVDLDGATRLLIFDEEMTRILRRKKKDIPLQYQWPIVTALSKPGTKPITKLWLGLKPNALPEPILRGFVRDGASYIVGHAWPQSDRAWRVVSVLEQCARVHQLSTLAKLEEARELCAALEASAHTDSHKAAAQALFASVMDDAREAALLMCAKAIEAKTALHAPNEGAIVLVLSKKLTSLCERALRQHPQQNILRRTI